MRNTLISIGTFLVVFFKFLFLNTIVLSLCIFTYILFDYISDKVQSIKSKRILVVVSVLINVLLVCCWYKLFGFWAVIMPCAIAFMIILAFFINLSDD